MVCDNGIESGTQAVGRRMVREHGPGLEPVAACQVLRHDSRHMVSVIAHTQNLAVVVGQITVLDSLRDERSQKQSLVGGLVVEHDAEPSDA